MIKELKDCKTCIHNRGGINCGLKDKYNDYKLEMKVLIDKWGEDNGFGFSLDCPSWYEEPNEKHIKHFVNPFTDDEGRPNKYVKKDKPLSARDAKIKPMSIKFENGSEIKTTPCDDTVVTRGRRSEQNPHYFDYEKCENKEELLETLIEALFR